MGVYLNMKQQRNSTGIQESPRTTSKSGGEMIIRIRRGKGADDPHEYFSQHVLRIRPRMTILDALVVLQNEQDVTLGFRYSCRVGMCGTCALRVNGRARWACRTRLEQFGKTITLEPLSHFPVIRDLVVDMVPFLEKMKRARGWIEPTDTASSAPAAIAPESHERENIEPFVECITCGICYASCSLVGHDPLYLGPAALNRAWTLICDSRDSAHEKRLREVADEHGIWRCHSQFNCTEACPKGISPATAIQGLKRRAIAKGTQNFLSSILRGHAPGV